MALKLVQLLPLVALLAALSVPSYPLHRAHMGRVVGRNKTRLCGSILRNAILYSCVASRWKREAMELPLPESIQIGSNKVLENVKSQSTSDPKMKELHGDDPPGKELSWTDLYKYYMDEKKNIPEIKEDPAWSNELKQGQRDHPPDTGPSWTDFLDLYNDHKEYIAAGADDGGWESPNEKGLANPSGSDVPQAKVKRKRDIELEMAIKCCTEGCTARDVAATFCLN